MRQLCAVKSEERPHSHSFRFVPTYALQAILEPIFTCSKKVCRSLSSFQVLLKGPVYFHGMVFRSSDRWTVTKKWAIYSVPLPANRSLGSTMDKETGEFKEGGSREAFSLLEFPAANFSSQTSLDGVATFSLPRGALLRLIFLFPRKTF